MLHDCSHCLLVPKKNNNITLLHQRFIGIVTDRKLRRKAERKQEKHSLTVETEDLPYYFEQTKEN